MPLKQENKPRVDKSETAWGDWDYDGERLVLYKGNLYSGYVVLDRFPDKSIENEIEYKNGSHIGWENEYNESGQLIYSCLTVGETSLEIYKYNDDGSLLDHWKAVDDGYYNEQVIKYNLD